jgi:hypothetical protein
MQHDGTSKVVPVLNELIEHMKTYGKVEEQLHHT